jgi:hypothetical protein
MMRTMHPPKRPHGVDTVLVGADAFDADASSIRDVLAGFDGVVQFSRRLLQAQVAQSLAERALNTVSARVGWEPSLAPPRLRAAVAARFHHLEVRPGIQLEVRLLMPILTGLSWPPHGSPDPVDPTPQGGRKGARESEVRALPRRVEISWQLEINLLTPSLQSAVDPQSAGPGSVGYFLERTLLGKGAAQAIAIP